MPRPLQGARVDFATLTTLRRVDALGCTQAHWPCAHRGVGAPTPWEGVGQGACGRAGGGSFVTQQMGLAKMTSEYVSEEGQANRPGGSLRSESCVEEVLNAWVQPAIATTVAYTAAPLATLHVARRDPAFHWLPMSPRAGSGRGLTLRSCVWPSEPASDSWPSAARCARAQRASCVESARYHRLTSPPPPPVPPSSTASAASA